jgi:hypothetical protein
MGWTDEFKQAETAAQERSRIEAELQLRNDRLLSAKAPESRDALIAQLEADCSNLEGRCRLIHVASGSWELIGNGSPIRRSSIKFMPVGSFFRIAKTHSFDGISQYQEGIEKVRMELQAGGSVAFVTDQETYPLVEQISRYLIMQVLQGKPQTTRERPY